MGFWVQFVFRGYFVPSLSLSIPLSNVNTKIYIEREAYGIVVFILEATNGRLCTYLCMQIIYIYRERESLIWGFK